MDSSELSAWWVLFQIRHEEAEALRAGAPPPTDEDTEEEARDTAAEEREAVAGDEDLNALLAEAMANAEAQKAAANGQS